jgi:hypothetical protein
MDDWMHVLLLHVMLLLQSLEDLEGERKEVKEMGSTRTNTNYHLLGMLGFWGVLLRTNTKLTHILGFFCVSVVFVCCKLTLTPSTKHAQYIHACCLDQSQCRCHEYDYLTSSKSI